MTLTMRFFPFASVVPRAELPERQAPMPPADTRAAPTPAFSTDGQCFACPAHKIQACQAANCPMDGKVLPP